MTPSKKHIMWTISLILLSVLLRTSWEAVDVFAQTGPWTEPVNISHTPNGSWFPDLAIDGLGNVHVIWCETTGVTGGHIEQVYYSMWDGQIWTEPNDIVPRSPDIIRNAIAADQMGNLHMLFSGSVPGIGQLDLFYKKASIRGAWSAAQWSTPHLISQSGNYMGDIAIDSKGIIHVIYDDSASCDSGTDGEGYTREFADIFYRRSTDGGQTWSSPVDLSPSPCTGSSREQMEIDSSDTIHVTWDEGWDRLTGRGDPIYSNYTFSSDGGETWASVATISYPDSTNAQLTVGGDGNGGVMLVWRATSRGELFYQWSSDGGGSWAPPAVIPGVFARPWGGPFDMYDIATDSAGHIHLVAVGREILDLDAPLAVYHLEWDGISWSKAETIYAGGGFPEYPKITISGGNRLHVVWFVREDLWEDTTREVWYSSSQSAAPYQTPVPSPTPTATPTLGPLPSPTPTVTPYPTLSAHSTDLPEGLYTESDEVFRLIIALSPVMLVVLLVVLVRLGWFSKLFR